MVGGVITKCQLPCVELQQYHTKTVHISAGLEFFISDELWREVGHRSHDDVTLCVNGGALVGGGARTLTSKTKVRELRHTVRVQQNISTE